MAYHVDPYDKSIVIDGWEKGIADSPHQGISNLQNVNLISVPGEASVGFATTKISSPAITVSVLSADAGTETLTFAATPSLEVGMAISFSATTITGVATNVCYWVKTKPTTATCTLATDYAMSSTLNIGSDGTGTFATFTVATPKHFASGIQGDFVVDSNGQVWSSIHLTTPSSFWTFTGNNTNTGAGNNSGVGNGLVYYRATAPRASPTGYLFVFRNSQIDYVVDNAAFSWVYGWNPTDASVANSTAYLATPAGTTNPHNALVTPNNKVNYCDGNFIGRWWQASPTTKFDPTVLSSYTNETGTGATSLLPGSDTAQCLTFLGTNLLVGGTKNVVYPWDMFSTTYSTPLILLSENNTTNMVTVNTNAYIFCGNRGRIYITNGSQAQLYKKVPDHLSGTVEPYYTWGGAAYIKNQLYFGLYAIGNNGSTSLPYYGGVWAVDVTTDALRLTNKLSYGTYDGYATAIFAQTGTTPAGAGLYIGWVSTVGGTGGLDQTTSTPYTSGEPVVESDLVPIGTYNKARDMQQVEFKLTMPLVAGESINLYSRTDFSQTYSTMTFLATPTTGDFSGTASSNFKNAQWLQLKAQLTSTASSPSYVRLKELRIIGLV